MDKIIEKLKQEARNSWTGKTGEERAKNLENFLRKTLTNYGKVLGFSQKDILEKLEERRSYSAINYYQTAHFPELDENVDVFETKKDFFNKYPSQKYICPSCGKVSTDPQECTQPDCDWKSYGLLGTLGKGYSFVCREIFLEEPVIYNIFMPVEND